MHLSNLDKVLWPDAGYTKADLIEYYAAVAPVLLPHLRNRPLSLTRHPTGIDGPSFYQKNKPQYAPAWIHSYSTGSVSGGGPEDAATRHIVADDVASLVWLANHGAIGIHPWLSTVTAPDKPDQIVIDLDPTPPTGFEEARNVAFVVRQLLEKMNLRSYPKVSGATGIHIYIPVAPVHSYTEAMRFARLVARIVAELIPAEATDERRVSRRGPRVYVDALQNLAGQTIVAPYSLRPLPGAPVSTPVTWEELLHCRPSEFTLATIPKRIARVGDLFAPVLTDEQDLSGWTDELHDSWQSLRL